MDGILITESMVLPQTDGIINVDTKNGPVVLQMRSGHSEDALVIKKVSNDKNSIALFSEDHLVSGNEITLFGVPKPSRLATATSVTLKYIKGAWQVIAEQ